MRNIRSLLATNPTFARWRSFPSIHSWLLCLCAFIAHHGHSQTATGSPTFEFGFAHVNQTNADDYIVESSGVRKYSEWQSPPTTYWGPAQNDVEGVLVYRFALPEAAGSYYLKAKDSSWDFNNEPGGFGRGCSALEVSRDGVNWIVLRNSLDSRQWGVDWSYEGDLPPEMIGATEVWLRLRFLCEGAPNSSYTVTQFGRSSSAATENVFDFRAYPVLRGQPPRFNTFMLQSFQAGSTTDIDNLRVIDLDTGEVVYSNDFSDASKATDNLQLFHFPQGGGNTTNFVVNGPMTRVVDGKLRLETTGFGSNGSGGYDSHSEAEYTQPLPHNFLVEFDAVRLQWAGHFGFHVSYRDPSDPPSSSEPFGSYTTNRLAPYRLDNLRMGSSGSWFHEYGLLTDVTGTNSSWPISFPAPPGSLQTTHKLGISLSNNIASFYLDGQLLNSAPIDDYLGSSGDFDSDGVNDYREQKDGTDPNDPDSFDPLSKGLVAYYPFDGDANDESGYGSNGTVSGAQLTEGRHGVAGTAYFFDGVDDEVAIQPSEPLIGLEGAVTVTAWIYNAGLGAPTYGSQDLQGIFGPATYLAWDSDGGFGLRLFDANHDAVNDRRYSFTVGAPRQDLDSASIVPEDRWDFVVASYDGNTMSIYRNGVLDASQNVGPSLTKGMNYVGNYFTIGQFVDWSAGTQRCPFHGKIDDVRIYNRALTVGEVGSLYEMETGSLDSDGDGLTDAWERGFGRYQVVENVIGWQEAKDAAESEGAQLATITSAFEESQMIAVLGGADGLSRWSYWIGAYHDGTEWTWATGEPWSFSNWSPYDDGAGGDQPYGVFFGMDQGAGYESARFLWGDLYVSSLASGYIVEFGYPTDPFNPDSDGDGFDDKVEADAGSDPNNPTSVPGFADTDGDGVTNYREAQDGTDPADPDSLNPLSKGLVAYYPFDSNANDESGYGNHGVPQGVDPAADRFGNSEKAYSFSGSVVPESNIKLTGSAVNITGGKTFSAWVKYEGGQENPRIFSTAGYEVSVNTGSRFAANQTDGSSVDTLEAPEGNIFGRFAHVVAVWSESGMSLYIDGLPAASKPWDGSSEADFSRGFFPEIGGNAGSEFDPFGGMIDDVRVYSRALSAREVGQLYQAEAGDLDSDGDGLTDVWERGFGRFSLISGSFDLSAAQQDAKARGGKLATFSTEAEWHAASSSLPEVVFAWIGATDNGSEGSWRWFDGTDWAFSNWGVGEPNNQDGIEHYVQIWGSFYSGQTNAWNDVHPGVTSSYLIEYGYPTDPLNPDSDSDGLTDGVETGTGVFLSSTDTGTNPLDSDTSGDGILDGEAVLWNFNPLTDYTQVLAFLRHATGVQSGRFALYTEGSIMDLNLGGVMIQKSGNQASVRFKVESKMDVRDPSWTDRGTFLLPPIDMPGSKGFLRIRAEQP